MADSAYSALFRGYDKLNSETDYEAWADFISACFDRFGKDVSSVLDLGCGTGAMTFPLRQRGYDMTAVDISPEMLSVARETAEEKEISDILWLCQDMREFELYGTVRAVYSACDSINYILEEDELVEVFRLVNNYLDPRGLFIFDINTEYKYKELMAEETFAENRSQGSFIWDNYYDEEEEINEYDLTLYIRDEDDKYLRFAEMHYQRCYSLEKIKELLAAAGMEFVAAYDGYSDKPVACDSERITIIAREVGK